MDEHERDGFDEETIEAARSLKDHDDEVVRGVAQLVLRSHLSSEGAGDR